MLPRSWKNSINNGVIIPVKTKRCNESKGKILCEECNNQVNENKKFEANLNILKRDVPNQLSLILLIYEV